MSRRIWLACLLTPLLSAACVSTPEPDASPLPSIPAVNGLSDRAEIESFLDRVVPAQLEADHLRGAAVAVVNDGELFFAKGYGFADAEGRVPVQADSTLFRAGSITKLLTATAVMQQVEQGRLTLSADVNHYLKRFQLPATYEQPITLEHLLTHSAGFEDCCGGLAASASDISELGDYLADNVPRRVRPPGELMAYSNYGVALAGFIVEEVTGLPIEQYLDERVLQPLGMRRSTFLQPPPPDLAASLSGGFRYKGGDFTAQRFEYIPVTPAGSLSATATDIARCMIAHLQEGSFGDVQLLQPATVRDMQRLHFTHDSRAAGMGLGFQQLRRNGREFIGHGGDTLLFHSALVLSPADGVGFYVAFNTAAPGPQHKLMTALLDHYYPARPEDLDYPELSSLHKVTGTYRTTRLSESTWHKVAGLFDRVRVGVYLDVLETSGLITLDSMPSQYITWAEVEPLIFRERHGDDTVYFRPGPDGSMVLFTDGFPPVAYIRVPWYDGDLVQFGVLAFCLLTFLSVVIAPIAGTLFRQPPHGSTPVMARRARLLAVELGGLNVIFVAGFVIAMLEYSQNPWGTPLLLYIVLAIPVATTVMALAVVAMAVQAWRQRFWGTAIRLHFSLLALAAIVFPIWLNHWNLLGWRL